MVVIERVQENNSEYVPVAIVSDVAVVSYDVVHGCGFRTWVLQIVYETMETAS